MSMAPFYIPRVKKILRRSSYDEAKQLLDEASQLSTAAEIEEYVKGRMAERFPEDFTLGYHRDETA